MVKRRELTEQEISWARNLSRIWLASKAGHGLNQEWLADQVGMTQPAVGQYLNAKIPLNTDAICAFARALKIDVTEIDEDFYERLGLVRRALIHKDAPARNAQQSAGGRTDRAVDGGDLQATLSPIAQGIVYRVQQLDADERLTSAIAGAVIAMLKAAPASTRQAEKSRPDIIFEAMGDEETKKLLGRGPMPAWPVRVKITQEMFAQVEQYTQAMGLPPDEVLPLLLRETPIELQVFDSSEELEHHESSAAPPATEKSPGVIHKRTAEELFRKQAIQDNKEAGVEQTKGHIKKIRTAEKPSQKAGKGREAEGN